MPLLKTDIRKLQPVLPQAARQRDNTSPYLTADSKTSSSIDAQQPTSSAPTSLSDRRSSPQQQQKKKYGALGTESPIIYWSEFENQEEEPFMVPVDETTGLLLPWRRMREREREREGGETPSERENLVVWSLKRVVGALEAGLKNSADGLSMLFMEKERHADEEDEMFTSEDDSSHVGQVLHPGGINRDFDEISHQALLNRGYALCVVGCTILMSVFGILGVILNGEAIGIAFVLVGFLLAMALEIVSLVRFIM